MINFNKFLFALLILIVGLFLQEGKIISLNSVSPNLLFILFLLFILGKESKLFLFGLLARVFLISLIAIPFWSQQIIVLCVLILLLSLGKKYLTGNNLLDFSLLIITIPIIFYLLLHIKNFKSLDINLILLESIYNLSLGIVIWLIFQRFYFKYEEF